jgi:hypothetical protein
MILMHIYKQNAAQTYLFGDVKAQEDSPPDTHAMSLVPAAVMPRVRVAEVGIISTSIIVVTTISTSVEVHWGGGAVESSAHTGKHS